MTDTVLKTTAMDILVRNLGVVQAEKFISLIIKESFDYTEWQKNLFEDMSVEDLSNEAMEFWNNKYANNEVT